MNAKDLIELGFTLNIVDKIKLPDPFSFPIFFEYHEMWTKIGQNEDDLLTGLTILCNVAENKDYKRIRIDGCSAPSAVYGHLGNKKFQGKIKNKKDLIRLLKQLELYISDGGIKSNK